ncbi:MAG: YciI family protein [Candidatus Udaeobacter sp.]
MPEFGSSSPKDDATRAGLKFGLMKNTFLAISSAGPNRDFSKGTREQPRWDEHAAFIDQLVDAGFILMGGPLVDEGGSLLIVNAKDENEVREKLKNDPWAEHGILKLESVRRWEIFIDNRK